MPSNVKPIRVLACGLLLLGSCMCRPEGAFAKQNATPGRLVVGVMTFPPFYMKTADNRWEGFAVELWEAVAREMGIPFEFREFNSLLLGLEALEKRKIDVIPTLVVKERYEATMEFSQSYLKSGLSIAVPAEDIDFRWTRIFEGMVRGYVLKSIGFFMLMSLIPGIIVWSLERRRNSEMFGKGIVEGVGNGSWWAMVTMATVGYGDKAPKSPGGRIIAICWMIFSMVFIANFTANIASSLTISGLKGKVRGYNDLNKARVGAIPRSEGFDFLTRKGITVIPIETNQKGLQAVVSKELDAFVQDDNILRYLVKSEFPGKVHVLPETFDEYFVGIALPQQSPLRKSLNIELLKFMQTQKWTELLNRYLK